jgi:hypothetical protein
MVDKTKMYKRAEYNIEYAHIYTNERFGIEHIKSIKKLHNIINKLKQLNKTYVLTVLIDEYNPTRHGLDIKGFLEKLNELNAKPDFVGFESQLTSYKDLLLKEIKGKMKKEYKNYIEKRGKIPCSFLIAIWHLKRLGLIPIKKGELNNLTKNNNVFTAEKIITILPKKYQEVEKKALKIIKSTKFKAWVKNIENIFY